MMIFIICFFDNFRGEAPFALKHLLNSANPSLFQEDFPSAPFVRKPLESRYVKKK